MSGSEFIDFSEETLPTVADLDAYERLRNGGRPSEDDSWLPLDLSELDDVPPVEPTLGGLGIVYPGKRHVFSGPQESAKTLAAYAIALEVIREGGRVVLLDFEMGRWDTRNRLRELGAIPDELKMISYVEPAEPATPSAIRRLVDLEPKLLLVDAAAGAYQLQGLDDNRRQDVEKFTAMYIRDFWRAEIASIVLDHVVKQAEGRGSYAIGSERKVGGVDVHLGFETVHPVKRGGTGLYKIVTHKDRGGFLKRGKLREFAVESDSENHALTVTFKVPVESDEEHRFRPTVLMEKVSRWLELQLEPVSQNAIEEQKLGKRDYVREALQILVVETYVDETSGPRRARLFESIRAYREASDPDISDFAPTSPPLRPESGYLTSPVFAPYEVRGEVNLGRGEVAENSPRGEDDIPW